MGGHRLPCRAVACYQVLVVAQLLPCREATVSGEVHLYQHLRHGQGNPSAMTNAALDGIENTATHVLEALL
jgi:hypothetical protein